MRKIKDKLYIESGERAKRLFYTVTKHSSANLQGEYGLTPMFDIHDMDRGLMTLHHEAGATILVMNENYLGYNGAKIVGNYTQESKAKLALDSLLGENNTLTLVPEHKRNPNSRSYVKS